MDPNYRARMTPRRSRIRSIGPRRWDRPDILDARTLIASLSVLNGNESRHRSRCGRCTSARRCGRKVGPTRNMGGRRQREFDKYAEPRRGALGRDLESHAVTRDDQEAGLADRLPTLPQRWLPSDHYFFERYGKPQYPAMHPNPGSDRPPAGCVHICGHARAHHHHRGLAHVSGQSQRIV